MWSGLWLKTKSWALRINLRSKEPSGGHPAWRAGRSSEQKTLSCPGFTQATETAEHSWSPGNEKEETKSKGALGLEEVWLLVEINSQAHKEDWQQPRQWINQHEEVKSQKTQTELCVMGHVVLVQSPRGTNGQRKSQGVPLLLLAQKLTACSPILCWTPICLYTRHKIQRKLTSWPKPVE